MSRIITTLKESYTDGIQKAYSITDLCEQNLDLLISTIWTWIKKLYGNSAFEYLSEQGLISAFDWRDYERLQHERKEGAGQIEETRIQEGHNNPIETAVEHLEYENTNIQTVIIGEGVKSIGESCLSFVKSMKNVCVSKSVIEVDQTVFEYPPRGLKSEKII